jgi:hypothetical protein
MALDPDEFDLDLEAFGDARLDKLLLRARISALQDTLDMLIDMVGVIAEQAGVELDESPREWYAVMKKFYIETFLEREEDMDPGNAARLQGMLAEKQECIEKWKRAKGQDT